MIRPGIISGTRANCEPMPSRGAEGMRALGATQDVRLLQYASYNMPRKEVIEEETARKKEQKLINKIKRKKDR